MSENALDIINRLLQSREGEALEFKEAAQTILAASGLRRK